MMNINQRFFKIEDEWNVVHLPERPNGFAILIVGDRNHYVEGSTSLWIQNPERFQLIEKLRENGYTIFYSNLFGRHWGSPKAVHLLKRIYHIMIRNEILNEKIHIITEGMGALAVLKLMNEMESCLRSVSMLSPCIDLKGFMETEKKNKLFYKRFLKELSSAYQINEKLVEEQVVKKFDVNKFIFNTPIKIWHSTSGVPYNVKDHSRLYEEICQKNNSSVSLSLHLFEKRYKIINSLLLHLKHHEQIL